MSKYKIIEVSTYDLSPEEIRFNILYDHKTDSVFTKFFIGDILLKHSTFSVSEFKDLDNCKKIKNAFSTEIVSTPNLQLVLSGIEISRLVWLCNGKEKSNLILGRTQIICSNAFDKMNLMNWRNSSNFKFVDAEIDDEFAEFLLKNNKLCRFSLFCNEKLLYTKMYKPYNSPLKFLIEDKEKIARWNELSKTL